MLVSDTEILASVGVMINLPLRALAKTIPSLTHTFSVIYYSMIVFVLLIYKTIDIVFLFMSVAQI